MIYDIFRFCFFIVFVGLHCAVMAGLLREWFFDRRFYAGIPRGNAEMSVRVSVIIPVHNEEQSLPEILAGLAKQDYPYAEYIFIDDRSTDSSAVMLENFVRGRPDARIVRLQENNAANKKQYALNEGIKCASGDFLLFTDADCEVPPSWIRAMASRLGDPQVGVVIAPVFRTPCKASFFRLYQCFDHAIRYMYLAGSTGLGAAGGGFGNNLILRRQALDAAGGYDKIPRSPTEDAALIGCIRSLKTWSVRSALGADVSIFTRSEAGWSTFLNQTLRWNNGGLFAPDLATRLNFGFLMLTIAAGIIALPLLPFIPSLWPLSVAVMLSMTMNSIATLRLFGHCLPQAGLHYIIQTVFTPCYFTWLTILGLCGRKPSWKGTRMK
ncbi:glycosyltransferase family 2 protein [Breznakiellaceae bacterium SP9]